MSMRSAQAATGGEDSEGEKPVQAAPRKRAARKRTPPKPKS